MKTIDVLNAAVEQSLPNAPVQTPKQPILISLVIPTQTQEKAQQCVQIWGNALNDLPAHSVELLPQVGCSSMSEAYNKGLAAAKGMITIFSHNDNYPFPLEQNKVGNRILEHMSKADVIGVAGASRVVADKWYMAGRPYCFGLVVNVSPTNPPPPGMIPLSTAIWEIPAKRVMGIKVLDGCCIIAKTDVAKKIGWDTRYKHFHGYDVDFSYEASRAGYKVAVVSDLLMCHQSAGSYNQPEWATAAEEFMKKFDGCFSAHPTLGMVYAYGNLGGADPITVYRNLKALMSMTQEEVTAA